MTIFSKIWLLLLILVAIPFFYLSARTLRTHQNWRTRYQDGKAKLDKMEKEGEDLAKGDITGESDLQGIRQLKGEWESAVKLRGRVWRRGKPGRPGPDGTIQVNLDEFPTHNIKKGLILYVFDERTPAEGGEYLGDFRVADDPVGTVIQLAPAQNYGPAHLNLKQGRLERLNAAANQGASWSLYDNLPIDSHAAFEGIDEQELNALFAGASGMKAAYLRDGKAPQADDPENRIAEVDGQRVYHRQLRDFQQIIFDLDRKMFRVSDEITSFGEDNTRLKTTETGSNLDQVYRTDDEEPDLQAKLAAATRELEGVTNEETNVRGQLETLRTEMESLFRENKAMAAKISRNQAAMLKAARSAP